MRAVGSCRTRFEAEGLPRREAASREAGTARRTNKAAAKAAAITGAFRTTRLLEVRVRAVKQKRPAESRSYAVSAYGCRSREISADDSRARVSRGLPPLEIAVVPGIDLDPGSGLDELRNHHLKPGFERRRLVGRGGGRPLHSRLRLDDLQGDRVRQLDPDGVSLVEVDGDHRVREQIGHLIADDFVLQRDLLEALVVHEVVAGRVGVEVLHLPFVEGGLLDPVGRAEAVLVHRPVAEISHLHLDEAPEIAGGLVDHFVDAVKLLVVNDERAASNLSCRDHHGRNPRRTAKSNRKRPRGNPGPFRFEPYTVSGRATCPGAYRGWDTGPRSSRRSPWR